MTLKLTFCISLFSVIAINNGTIYAQEKTVNKDTVYPLIKTLSKKTIQQIDTIAIQDSKGDLTQQKLEQ